MTSERNSLRTEQGGQMAGAGGGSGRQLVAEARHEAGGVQSVLKIL